MLLVPLLFSEANDIHPLAIIIAVLVFGAWFGVAGVFFAIPLAIFIKAMIEAWPRLGTPSSAEKPDVIVSAQCYRYDAGLFRERLD
jgi:predicted PurR-regulated permease PerM